MLLRQLFGVLLLQKQFNTTMFVILGIFVVTVSQAWGGFLDFHKVKYDPNERYNTIGGRFNHRTLLQGFYAFGPTPPYTMMELPLIGNPFDLPTKYSGLPNLYEKANGPPPTHCVVSATCNVQEICINEKCVPKPSEKERNRRRHYLNFINSQKLPNNAGLQKQQGGQCRHFCQLRDQIEQIKESMNKKRSGT